MYALPDANNNGNTNTFEPHSVYAAILFRMFFEQFSGDCAKHGITSV